MEPLTAREYRARGGVYPRGRGEGWTRYRELIGPPLGDDEPLSQLVRFPGPAALRRMLREDAPLTLHREGFDCVFVGDPEAIWAWEGVAAMGAVSLLDPWPLSPLRARGVDGFLIDARQVVPPETTVYVPDPECCRAVGPARTWEEARELLPPDYGARVGEALARIDRYIARALRVHGVLDRLDAMAPEEAAARLGEVDLAPAVLTRPLFQQPDAVLDRLEALRPRVVPEGGGGDTPMSTITRRR